MDLHGIVKGAIDAVNPRVLLQMQRSTGYTVGAGGVRTPAYAPAQTVRGQVQSLTFRDIQQVGGLNLQGTTRALYLEGNWDGLVRTSKKGGDLVTLPDNTVWLITHVLETWPRWCKVVITLQDGS